MCPRNEHQNTKCVSCKKLGHPEPGCSKSQKKERSSAIVVIETEKNPSDSACIIASVTPLEGDFRSTQKEGVTATTKRNADGEAATKQARQKNGDRFTVVQPQEVRFESSILQVKKKKKPERRIAKQALSKRSAKYDVIFELANASSNSTCGKPICRGDDIAKTNIRRLLSRGTRVRRNVTAVSAPNAGPRSLKVV